METETERNKDTETWRDGDRPRERDTRRQRWRMAAGGKWGVRAMALGTLEADGHDPGGRWPLMVI